MYQYENLVREHELRVAKSLERYELRKKQAARPESQGLVLFSRARQAVRGSRAGAGRRSRGAAVAE